MKLENKVKARRLIDAIDKIIAFTDEIRNTNEGAIVINEVEFQAAWLSGFEKDFVKELNSKIETHCDETIVKLEKLLEEL